MWLRICGTVIATILASFEFVQASETVEFEANHPIASSQRLEIPDGEMTISAALGNVSGQAVNDLDFFAFYGQEGDLVTLDIDGGYGGIRSVDTVIAVFTSDPSYRMLRLNDDAYPVDPGSGSVLDSRIENFRLPTTGYYIVGVSNFPRYFVDGGSVMSPNNLENGDYKLVVSGVSSPMLHINIEIKPGSEKLAPINPKSKGKTPVALLSSNEFNAMKVKTESLKFGPTGEEDSLSHCGRSGEDVNGDGRLDLVCHFDNQACGFNYGDLEGIVRGKTDDGRAFEGRGLLKVVPQKRR